MLVTGTVWALQNLKTRKLAVIYWLKIKLVKELK
jgi:hypothetical protein